MKENGAEPQCYEDFRRLSKPIQTRLVADCIRYEKRPRRLQQTKEVLDFIQRILRFAESRESAALNLRKEAGRLRAQVEALQIVLTSKIATATADTSSAQRVPEVRQETKEAMP